MREARLRLNLERCVFGITRGKVLRRLVSMKGIKANPDKIRAITHMRPPQNKKDVHKLIEHGGYYTWAPNVGITSRRLFIPEHGW
jgi:hypothetical protein